MSQSEHSIVKEFTRILGLENKTDGTIFFYKKNKNEGKVALKPDGYYYADGVTFILDAKAEGKKFSLQLSDYLRKEKNPNNVGFKYSGNVFECYIRGKLEDKETFPKTFSYYVSTYFPIKTTNADIVNQSAKKLANMFRDSHINRQMNVPFIGAVMLCNKFAEEEIEGETTDGILRSIKQGIQAAIAETPFPRKQKKLFLENTLSDSSLRAAPFTKLWDIISEISTIYNFINISEKIGHDTMNSFLVVFRRWNSVDAQEKGQVFTPDHIAQLMYRLISCGKEDTILDPTCGSGTFLTNAMANMLDGVKDDAERKEIMETHILGIESDEFNATLAGINMMLHGDGASSIYYADCFKKLPFLTNQYNKVLMNPPFSQKIKEISFVMAALDNMKQGGLCAAILPVSTLTDKPRNNELKKQLIARHRLIKTVLLPPKLFSPTAEIETCISVFQAKSTGSEFEMYDFSDDGFEIKMRAGRVDIDSEKKIRDFWEQQPVVSNVASNEWVRSAEIDPRLISKEDFQKSQVRNTHHKKDLDVLIIENDGDLHLDIGVSSKVLEVSKWKRYKIADLFAYLGKGADSAKDLSEGDVPLVNAKKNKNGVCKFVKDPKRLFKGGKITVVAQGDGGAGMSYWQKNRFCSYFFMHSARSNKSKNERWIRNFIATVMSKSFKPKYSHYRSLNKEKILKEEICLPSVGGSPDWDFMNSYIFASLS